MSALRDESSGEVFLYCTSTGRQRKEEAIRSRCQKRFEKDLQKVAEALNKKGGVRKYEKVLERLGLWHLYNMLTHVEAPFEVSKMSFPCAQSITVCLGGFKAMCS